MVAAQLIASAAAPVLPLLHGPPNAGTVLGAFTEAVIIGVGTADGPRVLSLLAPSAAGMPNGVRLTTADTGVLARRTPGEAVSLGAGRIALNDVQVRVVRGWACRVPSTAVHPRSIDTIAGQAASQPLGVPRELVAALQSVLRSVPGSTARESARAPSEAIPAVANHVLRSAVQPLIGRGLGLTPGGDDVLAGTLCGLWATGATGAVRALAAALADVTVLGDVTALTDRTTLLSADLLRLAADGYACLELLGVLRAADPAREMVRPNRSALHVALDRLLRVGHTSGADLATGLAVGLLIGCAAASRERSEVR